jgi:hypothetical protein
MLNAGSQRSLHYSAGILHRNEIGLLYSGGEESVRPLLVSRHT